jgi:DNA-binding transcriptional regulator YiaG
MMKRQRYRNRSLENIVVELRMNRSEFARLVGTSGATVQGWITRRNKRLTWPWTLRIEVVTGQF